MLAHGAGPDHSASRGAGGGLTANFIALFLRASSARITRSTLELHYKPLAMPGACSLFDLCPRQGSKIRRAHGLFLRPEKRINRIHVLRTRDICQPIPVQAPEGNHTHQKRRKIRDVRQRYGLTQTATFPPCRAFWPHTCCSKPATQACLPPAEFGCVLLSAPEVNWLALRDTGSFSSRSQSPSACRTADVHKRQHGIALTARIVLAHYTQRPHEQQTSVARQAA